MESGFQKLTLHAGDLSTVRENDTHTFSEKDRHRRIKTITQSDLDQHDLLEKFKDDYKDEEFDFEDYDVEQLKGNLISKKTPRREKQSVIDEDKCESRSKSIFSTRTPSSISKFSESETDHSDYADEFYDLDELNDMDVAVKLLQNFQRRQKKALVLAEKNKLRKLTQSFSSRNFSKYKDETDEDWEFDSDDLKNVDFNKMDNFKNHQNTLSSKKSMPIIKMATSLHGSPKKIMKKYSSTMDINRCIPNTRYENNPLASLNERDLLNLMEENEKEKTRNSSAHLDYSKYIEVPTSRQERNLRKSARGNSNSYTSKLLKQGKLKLIKSLEKPKYEKLKGHLYGEIRFDPELKKWCGNDEDLKRFETIRSSSYVKPKLIKKNDVPSKAFDSQVVNGMIYDKKKLRWVSITGKYEDDPFADLEEESDNDNDNLDNTLVIETAKQSPPRIRKTRLQSKSHPSKFSVGRLVPSESTMSLKDNLKTSNSNHFKIKPEMYKNWKTEEERWIRKVVNWFPNDEDAHKFKYDLKIILNKQ